MEFSIVIKDIRQKNFHTQQEFADQIGVSFSTVNRWETQKAIPNYKTMKRLIEYCRKFGVDYQKLEDVWKENKNGADSR